MTLYQVLSLLGAGSLLVGVFRLLFAQIKGVRLGVQALLRAQMIADYNKWNGGTPRSMLAKISSTAGRSITAWASTVSWTT